MVSGFRGHSPCNREHTLGDRKHALGDRFFCRPKRKPAIGGQKRPPRGRPSSMLMQIYNNKCRKANRPFPRHRQEKVCKKESVFYPGGQEGYQKKMFERRGPPGGAVPHSALKLQRRTDKARLVAAFFHHFAMSEGQTAAIELKFILKRRAALGGYNKSHYLCS